MTYQPKRGDDIEAWIKAMRDVWPKDHTLWIAWDNALDDYRLHADTGTLLGQEVSEHG